VTTPSLPDLYAYLDYRAYLRDWFAAKKKANPRFSHRAFALRAKQSSPSLLLHVMDGKRNLTPATTTGFCRAMSMNAEDTAFFRALVELAQADEHARRTDAWERVRATKRFREARRLDDEAVEYLSHWYGPAIRELAAVQPLPDDPAWIAARVRPKITVANARDALTTLTALGLLTKKEDGLLHPTEASVVTPREVAGLAAMRYHGEMIDRARDALESVPSHRRHFCAVTVPLPVSLMPRLKQELDELQMRLLDLCDSAEAPKDAVFQINLNLFPLSAELPEGTDTPR
jgi:uncharacterized protein (TIGR02147 family)